MQDAFGLQMHMKSIVDRKFGAYNGVIKRVSVGVWIKTIDALKKAYDDDVLQHKAMYTSDTVADEIVFIWLPLIHRNALWSPMID